MFDRFTIYLLFFLSGFAALVYQVLWVRSFSLFFGGSHLAVTTVLAVFMGGLALGGYLGRHLKDNPRPLQLYGWLEIGIGAAAIMLLGLLQLYPDLYVGYARMVDHQPGALMLGRLGFAVVVLLLPTTLMGLTLPVLAGFSRTTDNLGRHLAWLYGINTLGAVGGALAAGFFLLRFLQVSTTYALAVGISILIGLGSFILSARFHRNGISDNLQSEVVPSQQPARPDSPIPARLILAGIGLSGFCALGYEVLWTRVLSIVVGATVYAYTLMLVAFLIGIALGGASYRLWVRPARAENSAGSMVRWFGLIQLLIGVLAIIVSYALRDLPNQIVFIETILKGVLAPTAEIRHLTNFSMAVFYMLIPAFFMGLAFPLAADLIARARGTIGQAVGETLTSNTLGAILGASVSGFVLVPLFGIERSLQCLALLNLGLGLTVCASRLKTRWVAPVPGLVITALLLVLVLQPGLLKFWDLKYFAVFNNNARAVFAEEQKRADILANSEVLYYAEGTTSTISVVTFKGVSQGVNVNGKTVASTHLKDRQCQYTLGHLPMLLHPNPRKVWVLGLGTGMTAGATTVHPEVESVTVVEMEKQVVEAARTFAPWNHNLLDNPKVDIVFNDGRNFLLTTEEQYDVITADPIHPWAQGAAYLYTDEYYRLAASRLRPGGVMTQWLPIYELTPRDLQSVVKTFSNNFNEVYIWLTDYDAELIGSNDPILIDPAVIQARIDASPAVLSDLREVHMGSAAAFLSYAIMGPQASRAYGEEGPLNTDNNLYLEFSAPKSVEKSELTAQNISSLSAYREDISSYFQGDSLATLLGTNDLHFRQATQVYDQAHLMHYQGRVREPFFEQLITRLEQHYPWYAPGRFLQGEYQRFLAQQPQVLQEMILPMAHDDGQILEYHFAAVSSKISPEVAKLMIAENLERKIYGSVFIEGDREQLDQRITTLADSLMQQIEAIHQHQKGINATVPGAVTLEQIEIAIKHIMADAG